MEYTAFDCAYKQVDETGTFEAHVSTFGNRDRQNDIVMPGAFTRTLKETKGRVPFLMGHNMGRIIGFGTHAEEDSKGLLVRGEFTLESDEGRNAYATARHAAKVGHKLGLSIGYGIADGGAAYDERRGVRKLTDIDLFEYSIAAVPANDRARGMTVKSESDRWTEREFEEHLREVGFSKDAARVITNRGFRALVTDRWDADCGGSKGADPAFLAEIRDLTVFLQITGA